jgi:hypothetical protein
MDILAHGLWAGAAVVAVSRQRPPASLWGWTVALAVVPDLVHMLPVSGWALATQTSTEWWQYATASPGQEPPMPHAILFWAHHLHCVFHSAIVASLVSAIVWWRRGALWLPLLGWWSHIVIDVFTHSADFFPSPVWYPLTYWGFDGVAWNRPGFVWVNYLALAGVWGWLVWRARKRQLR